MDRSRRMENQVFLEETKIRRNVAGVITVASLIAWYVPFIYSLIMGYMNWVYVPSFIISFIASIVAAYVWIQESDLADFIVRHMEEPELKRYMEEVGKRWTD